MGSLESVQSARAAAQRLKKALLRIQDRPNVRVEWGDNAYSEDLAWIEKWMRQLEEGRVNEVWRGVQHISRIISAFGDINVRPLITDFRDAVFEAVVEVRSKE